MRMETKSEVMLCFWNRKLNGNNFLIINQTTYHNILINKFVIVVVIKEPVY